MPLPAAIATKIRTLFDAAETAGDNTATEWPVSIFGQDYKIRVDLRRFPNDIIIRLMRK